MAENPRRIQKICEYCGNTFMAHRMTTRYCSHRCNSRDYKKRKKEEALQQVKEHTQNEIEQKTIQPLNEKEILNVAEAAIFIGVCRQTVYNMIHSGVLKAAQITERLSLIRRKDIEALFDNPEPYKARPARTRTPISELYTVAEIKEKYKVNESWIFIVAKKTTFRERSKKARPISAGSMWMSILQKRHQIRLLQNGIPPMISKKNTTCLSIRYIVLYLTMLFLRKRKDGSFFTPKHM